MLLSIEDLQKSYPGPGGPVAVLRGVTLSLDAGETLALTGESGSGKSTLLHLVAGLDAANGGRVLLDGQEVTALEAQYGDRGEASCAGSNDAGV
ncbi:ABC-type lipoprotein export system ATPase subunit [Aquamicrobium ahrensii]|uniref:ABC-type lipoprotein export system ATPase subunit n=1 Tax=Aquamicrobium ahrensii TaxID=469551 RepID=A0ABV2KPR4_9HYPH